MAERVPLLIIIFLIIIVSLGLGITFSPVISMYSLTGRVIATTESNWKTGMVSGNTKTSFEGLTNQQVEDIIRNDFYKSLLLFAGAVLIVFIISLFSYLYKIKKLSMIKNKKN